MWYQAQMCVFYIDDSDTVWKVRDDGAFIKTDLYSELVANCWPRIEQPSYASNVLRAIETLRSMEPMSRLAA